MKPILNHGYALNSLHSYNLDLGESHHLIMRIMLKCFFCIPLMCSIFFLSSVFFWPISFLPCPDLNHKAQAHGCNKQGHLDFFGLCVAYVVSCCLFDLSILHHGFFKTFRVLTRARLFLFPFIGVVNGFTRIVQLL